MSQYGSRGRPFLKIGHWQYYTELYSTRLLAALRSDCFVCAVILNTRLGKSVYSFNSLSMNQQESLRNHPVTEMIVWYCLRSLYQFPKILFRDLSNLFTSASNSKQWLCWLAFYKLNSVMVPLETACFGYSSHSFATVVVYSNSNCFALSLQNIRYLINLSLFLLKFR